MLKTVFSLLFLIVLTNCKTQTEPVATYHSFPESYKEFGQDADHSFMSLQTIIDENQDIVATIRGWAIREEGIYLETRFQERTLELQAKAICGTVDTRTWVKFKLTYIVPDSVKLPLQRIQYKRHQTTLTISRN